VGSVVLRQAAMGGGDAKYLAMLTWLGWKYLLLAGFLACGVGAFVGGAAIASEHFSTTTNPWSLLALGAVITLFGGEAILSALRCLPPELLTKIK